jgi:hypothetical protein
MPEKTLEFYQVYYKEEQLSHLYDFAIPYFNQEVNPFLENSVIKSLVPNSIGDLISVSSWKLKHKRNSMPSKHVLRHNASKKLSKDTILSSEFDVAILTPRIDGHKTLFMSQHWHGQAWTDSFSVLSTFLLQELNIEVPNELKFAIYENHFIAKGQIYREYVSQCLTPAIEFMQNEIVFKTPSGYRKQKEWLGDFETITDYERATGLEDWPIGVFLLERLFSIWINNKNYSVINL